MTVWFTSDTHFWHKAIIGYCKRPVWDASKEDYTTDVAVMNEWLISHWNVKVKPDDQVWHLGDFAFCGFEKYKEIVSRLNGQINLIVGNHDYGLIKKIKEWSGCGSPFDKVRSIQDYKMLRQNIVYEDDEGENKQYAQPIVLCHFPILSWDGMAHGSWHLHGHCHGSIDRTWNSTGLRMDVGVDAEGINWSPISLEEVQNRMALRTVVPVDHHK